MILMRKGEIYRGKKDDPSRHVYHPVVVYEDVTDKMDFFKAFILTDHPVKDSPIKDVPFRDFDFMDTNYPICNSEKRVHDVVDFGYLKDVRHINVVLAGKLTEKGLKELDKIANGDPRREYKYIKYTLMNQAECQKLQNK